MRRIFKLLTVLFVFLLISGFTYINEDKEENTSAFELGDLYNYQKVFKSEEIDVCASGVAKTYMDYRATTARNSRQYKFIHNNLTVDETTGFLYDEDGFIGVALGSFYGEIGDRFYFTLESGVVLPLVKCEEKAKKLLQSPYNILYNKLSARKRKRKRKRHLAATAAPEQRSVEYDSKFEELHEAE